MTFTPGKLLISLAVTFLALGHPVKGDGATYSFQEGDLRNVTTDTLIDGNYTTQATYLFEKSKNSNYDATGTIKVGYDFSQRPDANFTGLFGFDLSEIPEPSHAALLDVKSATLKVYIYATSGGGSKTHVLHAYEHDLFEAAATWNDPAGNGSDTIFGGKAGANLNSMVSYTGGGGAPAYKTFAGSPEFVAAVSNALARADRTLRLIVPGAVWDNGHFRDDEYEVVEQRPELIVTYTFIPSSGAVFIAR